MAQRFVIGLDVGTTGCKAVLVTPRGVVRAAASAGYPLHTPAVDRAEQDVGQIERAVTQVLRAVARRSLPGELAGLCLSGAMHSLMPIDAAGQPLARALTWADNRAAEQACALRSLRSSDANYRRTGCPTTGLYHVAKLRWFHEHEPAMVRRTARWVGIKDYLVHRLTGRWAIDWSLASATGLLDIHRLHWHAPALRQARVSASALPELAVPGEQIGSIRPAAARRTGLPAGLPVITGGSDGALANVGSGAVLAGQMVVTVGTTGAVRIIVDRPRLAQGQQTWCYVLERGRYFAGGAINNAGLLVQWVRERFYSDLPPVAGFKRLFADAASVAPGSDGLVMLPYLTGERSPHWNTDARAALVGLTLRHGRAHVARAALEAVGYCLADVCLALHVTASGAAAARLTGGITASRVWRQILADVLGIDLAPVDVADASAIGAAMLGHVSLGQIDDLDQLAVRADECRTLVRPDAKRHAEYRKLHERFRMLAERVCLTQPRG